MATGPNTQRSFMCQASKTSQIIVCLDGHSPMRQTSRGYVGPSITIVITIIPFEPIGWATVVQFKLRIKKTKAFEDMINRILHWKNQKKTRLRRKCCREGLGKFWTIVVGPMCCRGIVAEGCCKKCWEKNSTKTARIARNKCCENFAEPPGGDR